MKVNLVNLQSPYNSRANFSTPKNKATHYQATTFTKNIDNNISFNGLSDLILKLQAKKLGREANSVSKEGSTSRMEAYSLQQYSSKLKKESLIIKADSTVLYKDVQKVLDEARKKGFPNKVDKSTGQMIREFYDGDDGQFIMEEYDSKGRTIRKTIIDKEITLVIKENKSTNKDDAYAFDTLNGELVEFSRGLQIVGDGYRADENFSYFDGELSAYDNKYKLIREGKENSREHFAFCDGKLDKYCFDWKFEKGVYEKASEYYSFIDGKLLKNLTEYKEYFGKHLEAVEEYFFDIDGGLTSCAKKVHHSKTKDNSSTAEKMFKFGDLGLEKIYLNLICTHNDDKITAQKLYKCADEKIKGCAFDYEYHKNGAEKFSSYIAIK